MTAIKNGIKTTLRTPLKTILFSTVLILLAALLTVSLCVFSAVRSYLDDCDEYYHTIATLEYIGGDYPNATVYDAALAEALNTHADALDALVHADGAISFTRDSNAAAIADGLHRWDNYVYDGNSAVLRLYHPVYNEQIDAYLAIVSESYYSRKDYKGKLVMMRSDWLSEPEDRLDEKQTYLAVGRFFLGQTSNPWFYAEPASYVENGETVRLSTATPVDADQNILDRYLHYADLLRMQNDNCRVQYTSAIEDLLPFQQQMISVSDGRLFTAEEYASRAHVCIVSERIAGALEASVGDTIPLMVYLAERDLYAPSEWIETDGGAYEIVGIYADTEDYPYRIFLPDAAAAGDIAPVTGYSLGQFRLANSKAEAFLQQADALTEFGFRVTVYDQGYAAATEPMREMMFLSIVFLAVCLLLTVAAHALQSYLFVSRQKETALTMHALGSGRAHVLLYFSSAALLLALVSSAIGCGVGKLLEGRVMDVIRRFALQFADHDLRFSDSRLSLSRTLAFAPTVPLRVYLISVGTLVGGSALFTLFFAARTLRTKEPKKKRRAMLQQAPKKAGKSSRLSGRLKYALLSMRRGVVRTVAVVLLCMIVAVFFGQLTGSLDGYEAQLVSYRENAVISGFATDMTGRLMDGLAIRSRYARDLAGTGLLAEQAFSDTIGSGMVLGVAKRADGSPCEPPSFVIPGSAFAYETLEYNLSNTMKIVDTISLSMSPALFYAKTKDIEWLDGYSDEDFKGFQTVCAMPQSLMDEYGIMLGDTVRFVGEEDYIMLADIKVVASYASASPKPVLFCPIGFDLALADPILAEVDWDATADDTAENGELEYDPSVLYDPELLEYEWEKRSRTYDSYRFTLRDANDLDALRQALDDAGFSYVHSGERGKPFAIIEDEVYLNTVHSMERQIQYVGVLYNSLYIIAGVIGFVLAWLLTLSRRGEISVMRAMGTQPLRILCNFQFEQAALSVFGLLIGLGLSLLFGVALTPMLPILCGAFFVIWNLATFACLLMGLTKQSYASLSEPD